LAPKARNRRLTIYQTVEGKQPFTEWFTSIRDAKTRIRIRRRLDRVELGNLGDHKAVGAGVFELRLFFGTGYRVYYAEDGDTVVLLLCGGDKQSQTRDITKAKTYWQDYKRRAL